MSTVLNFVRTFPSLSATIVAVIFIVPIVIEMIDFIFRLAGRLG